MAYVPKNNFNLKLKRTGVGEVGFRKKLLADVACCDSPHYQFYGGFQDDTSGDLSRDVIISGGCPNFSWVAEGPYFSVLNATTAGRTNTIIADAATPQGTSDIITIIDSCGKEIYITVVLLGDFCGVTRIGAYVSYTTPLPAYAVYGAGYDNEGRLGLGDIAYPTSRTTFVPSLTSQKFIGVGCATNHTLAITKRGKLFATGSNSVGSFGNGTVVGSNIFLEVSSGVWTMLSVGGDSTYVLKDDGTLWVTGNNDEGQLGLDDKVERHSFTQEVLLKDWEFVIAQDQSNTLAIEKSTRFLYGTGHYDSGVLSQHYWEAGAHYALVFTQIKYDDGGSKPFPNDESRWKFASVGAQSSLAIKENGTLWGSGANGRGQLGLGHTDAVYMFKQVGTSLWSSVSTQALSSVAIKEDGTLWGCGKNEAGALGLGDTTQRTSFTQISAESWKKVVMLAGSRMIAIKSDDTLWGCGQNSNYQLGLDHKNSVLTLTHIGSSIWKDIHGSVDHSMALLLE